MIGYKADRKEVLKPKFLQFQLPISCIREESLKEKKLHFQALNLGSDSDKSTADSINVKALEENDSKKGIKSSNGKKILFKTENKEGNKGLFIKEELIDDKNTNTKNEINDIIDKTKREKEKENIIKNKNKNNVVLNNNINGNTFNYNYDVNNYNNFIFNQSRYNQNNQFLLKIAQQIVEIQKYKQLGLSEISKPQNKNHYLWNNMLMKINLGNIMNANNIYPFFPMNNFINNNYYGNQNILLRNYFINQNIINRNSLNNLNNLTGSAIPENCTIFLKNDTIIPEVKQYSKIKVTTSYVKDVSNKNEKNKENKNKEKCEKNLINLDDIISGKETKTVVRLNPIPPNYSSFDISKLLDKYLKIESGKNQRIYKAVYTPLCKIIGKNLGFCFIMMAKPKYVYDFYRTFNGRIFNKKKCKKPCCVIWANIQGEDFLKINEDDPIRRPIIFKDLKDD